MCLCTFKDAFSFAFGVNLCNGWWHMNYRIGTSLQLSPLS